MYWKIIFTLLAIAAAVVVYNYRQQIQSWLQTLQTQENYMEESGNTLFLSKNI